MKLWEIFRFEVAYQSRRVSTWLYFAILLGATFQIATQAYAGKARSGGYLFNSPYIVAEVTLLGSVLGLLMATGIAGDAAGRDVQTRMHPLLYTTPVGRAGYLWGRFLAAFALHALILVAVPAGLLLAGLLSEPEAGLVGPFRPAAYLGAYFFLALPNAFVAAALLFSVAALSRRAVASYVGSVLLLFAALLSLQLVATRLGRWELAKLTDPLGLTWMSELARTTTPVQKNTLRIGLEGSLLANRLVWLGIALGVLALTHLRFRFAHLAPGSRWSPGARRGDAPAPEPGSGLGRAAPIAVPRVRRTFAFATHARQALAVARESFRAVVTSWGARFAAAVSVLLTLATPRAMARMGVPLHPTTERMTALLAVPLTRPGDLFWMIVPLLIVFHAGELVWREREAGLGDISDAAPVPEWAPLLGKLAGLGLALAALQALMVAAGVLAQWFLGHRDLEISLYGRILLGLQLADYLLFVVLALAVHGVVDQKYVGHLVVLVAYALMVFAPALGIEHGLLVYGSDPGWEYSDMRGFGPFLGPWLWFKLYWAAWALLLAVAARLLWPRGRERGLASRLRVARRRFTRPVAGAAALAAGLVLALGGFVFYNVNVLNPYRTAADELERRAEYERRFGRFEGVPQPRLEGTRLHVEIFPERREVAIRGAYRLVNRTDRPIDSVHLVTPSRVRTGAIRFHRRATRVLADRELGHGIYALATPLRPGDSLRLDFEVRFQPRGFPNRGVDASVAANGTYFTHREWLPAVGYQAGRELDNAGDRRAHGLPPRPALPPLHDVRARYDAAEWIAFEAVVGTAEGQVAVAPGRLRRTWTERGRRYFHYATDAPIGNDYAFYSAAYAVRDARWNDVAIQVFHHPGHAWNVDRMIRSVRASLDYHIRRFGPYPHGQIRLVEHPGRGSTLHSAPVNVSYQEGFSLLKPGDDPRGFDLPFAIVAHEVAHQWWGGQLRPADVEGGALLTESLAWYSAMGVVEESYGPEHLRRLLGMMREAYLTPHTRAAVPLLRADGWLLAYRKGPFALYALREHVGEERVDAALRRLLRRHGSGAPPLPTSLDLLRELRAVTPDSLRYLLHDLFEANTYWELAAERATAEPAGAGAWRVTLDVRARKVVVDSAGAEREVPMDDLVQVGVFAAEDGATGAPLYLRTHRVRSGEQRVVVTVPGRPARAGIDPRGLLVDTSADDNLREVTRGGHRGGEGPRPGDRGRVSRARETAGQPATPATGRGASLGLAAGARAPGAPRRTGFLRTRHSQYGITRSGRNAGIASRGKTRSGSGNSSACPRKNEPVAMNMAKHMRHRCLASRDAPRSAAERIHRRSDAPAASAIVPKTKSMGTGIPSLALSPRTTDSIPSETLDTPTASASSMSPRSSRRDPGVGGRTVVSAVITR